jgi:hypothetical protein
MTITPDTYTREDREAQHQTLTKPSNVLDRDGSARP